MAQRVAQDRVSAGCLWALAIGWAILSWLWSLLPAGRSHSALFDVIAVGSLFLAALYFTIDRQRFPAATLSFDALPAPGHTFLAKVETPLKIEPASGVRVRLRATHYVRKPGRTTVWSKTVDAHPLRGEHGIIVPVEVAVPAELPQDLGALDWDVTARAIVPFGLYWAKFPVRAPP